MTTCWQWAEMTPAHSVGPFTTNTQLCLFWFGMHLFFYAGSSAEYISEGRRGRRSHNPRDAKKVAGSVIYPFFVGFFFSPAPSDVRTKTPPAVFQLHPVFARLDPEPELKGTVQDFACKGFHRKKKKKPSVESIGATQHVVCQQKDCSVEGSKGKTCSL